MREPIEIRGPSLLLLLLAVTAGAPGAIGAQDGYDYHRATADLVERGRQALTICNGLFVSDRTLEQIFDGELRTRPVPSDMLRVDRDLEAAAVGGFGNDPIPTMRAAHREGLGCVVMAPHQTFADVEELPVLRASPPPGDPARIPWPDGDLVEEQPPPDHVDAAALEAAGDWTFDREAHGEPGQMTLSLLVVHRGDILYERYAPGIDRTTKTRTWSTAKSIAGTLIGIAAGDGLLELDAPLPLDVWPPDELAELEYRVRSEHPALPLERWPPEDHRNAPDPRRDVTLRDVLQMSSGLYPVDNEHAVTVGSMLSYFAGRNSAHHAADRGLVREPGTVWDYENYDTLLGVLTLKTALGDDRTYLEYPRRALFDRIGMRNTVPGVDRFGNYVMSSQVYTNARDLARLGLLYLNGGTWNGERILPREWVEFSRTPAPSTREFGRFYGGQWWLVPDARTDLPRDAYTTAGARGQYTIVIPSHELVIVRRGLDNTRLPYWDMVAEILEAFPDRPGGEKPEVGSRNE